MPLIARDLIGGDAVTYGVLLGSFGFGAVLGALTSTVLRIETACAAIAAVVMADAR